MLKYLFSKADVSEAFLNCVKLVLVQFAGDDVLHHFAVLAVNVPADAHYLLPLSVSMIGSEKW